MNSNMKWEEYNVAVTMSPEGKLTKGKSGDSLFGNVTLRTTKPAYKDQLSLAPLQPVSLHHINHMGESIQAWHIHDETPVPPEFHPMQDGKDNSEAFEYFKSKAISGDKEAARKLLTTFFVYLHDESIMPKTMREYLISSFTQIFAGNSPNDVFYLGKRRGRKRNESDDEIIIALKVETLIGKGMSQKQACRQLAEEQPTLISQYSQQQKKETPGAGFVRIHNKYKQAIRSIRSSEIPPGTVALLGNVVVKKS